MLLPIEPRSADGPDAWIASCEGARAEVWVRLDAALSSQRPGFAWSLLAGAPGSGKTRLALELARLRPGAWRLHPDAWTPSWRPNRPALLLLDDAPAALPGAVASLAAHAAQYRFPVHLLATARTFPEAAGLRCGREKWVAALPCFSGIAAMLPGLTPTELRMLALRAGLPRAGWRDLEVDRFLDATGGNPLLARWGLEWLRAGGAPRAVSCGELLRWRLRGLFAALAGAGLDDPGHLRALAAATLAGSADAPAAAGPARPLLEGPPPPPEGLRAVFGPVAPDRLPPVLPSLLGDGFVRAVIARDPSWSRRIALCAWRMDRERTALAAERLLPADDELAAALAGTMAAEADPDPVESALALCRAAVQTQRWAWDCGGHGPRPHALARALAAIDGLPPARAAAAIGRFAALMAVDSRMTVANGPAGFSCGCAVVRRGLQAPAASWSRPGAAREAAEALASLLRHAVRWGLDESAVSPDDLATPARLAGHLDRHGGIDLRAACWNQLARLLDERGGVIPRMAGLLLGALAGSGNEANGCSGHAAAATRLRLCGAAIGGAPAALIEAAGALEAAAGDRTGVLEALRAWRQAAYAAARADDRESCAAALARMAACAERLGGARDGLLELARGMKGLVFLHAGRHDPVRCEAAAGACDALALRFPEDRDFALIRAELSMYRAECRSRNGDAAGCEAVVRELETTLASGFAGDRDFELARARGWTDLAFLRAAAPGDPVAAAAGCAAAVARVAAARDAFAGEAAFEAEHAMALKQLAFAHARAGDAAGSAGAARRIGRLLRAGFVGGARLEADHAQAWLHAAGAHLAAGEPAEAGEAAARAARALAARPGAEADAGAGTDPGPCPLAAHLAALNDAIVHAPCHTA